MRTIVLKRHRKVVTLAEVEHSLDDILDGIQREALFNGKQVSVAIVRMLVRNERRHLRSRFLYATEFEVPKDRDLSD